MKNLHIQIGTFRLREPITKHLLMSVPIYKNVTQKQAETFFDNAAKILLDCYRDYEKCGTAKRACA